MRKPMVAGNWKMNGSIAQVEKLLSSIKQRSHECDVVDLVVCPPYPYLAQSRYLLLGTDIKLGAQNASEQTEGAFTGAVSANMFREFGCE